MKIHIDPHTLQRAKERGTNEEEIQDVIKTGILIPAKYGRLGKAEIFDFSQKRHGKFYEQKKVEVFYTVEEEVLISVTAYVYYGIWEAKDADHL